MSVVYLPDEHLNWEPLHAFWNSWWNGGARNIGHHLRVRIFFNFKQFVENSKEEEGTQNYISNPGFVYSKGSFLCCCDPDWSLLDHPGCSSTWLNSCSRKLQINVLINGSRERLNIPIKTSCNWICSTVANGFCWWCCGRVYGMLYERYRKQSTYILDPPPLVHVSRKAKRWEWGEVLLYVI